MQFLTFVNKTALARVTATATPFGTVVAIADFAELEARMRSHTESCVIVDPALLLVAEAEVFSKVAAELSEPVLAYTSLTLGAMQSAVVLALHAHAQFVYQGTSDERSALARALLAIPGPEFGGALVTALSPWLGRLAPPLREVVIAMLRTGSGALSSPGLASRTGVPRRTMDRSVVSAGFISTRLLIAAAKIVRSYRAVTTTGTSFKRIAAALGYASQRTLDQQYLDLLGAGVVAVRQAPIPLPKAADILVSRIIRSAECRGIVDKCKPDDSPFHDMRKPNLAQQVAHPEMTGRSLGQLAAMGEMVP